MKNPLGALIPAIFFFACDTLNLCYEVYKNHHWDDDVGVIRSSSGSQIEFTRGQHRGGFRGKPIEYRTIILGNRGWATMSPSTRR